MFMRVVTEENQEEIINLNHVIRITSDGTIDWSLYLDNDEVMHIKEFEVLSCASTKSSFKKSMNKLNVRNVKHELGIIEGDK